VDERVARVVNKVQKLRKKVELVGVRGSGGRRDEGGEGVMNGGSNEGRREGCGMDLVKLYF